MSEEETKRAWAIMAGGPAEGMLKVREGSNEVSVWNGDVMVAIYRRTRLSVVEKDSVIPIFQCVLR